MDTLYTDIFDPLPPLDTPSRETETDDAGLISSSTSSADIERTATVSQELLPSDGPSFAYLFQKLVTEKEPLILLGESPTRALSIAFGVMRGSLKNIWATRLYADRHFWTPADFLQHIEQSRLRGDENAGFLATYWGFHYDTGAEYDNFINNCKDAVAEMDCLPNFSLRADARHLPIFITESGLRHLVHKHIFFQCPWDGFVQTGRLLEDTASSAAEIQGPGDLLLFGLIDTRLEAYSDLNSSRSDLYARYRNAYNIPALKNCAVRHGYKCLAEDKELIKRCLCFGYRHLSESLWVDLHHRMLRNNELIIYVFVKM